MQHALFDDVVLFEALNAFRVRPLPDKRCAPLETWLNEAVYCVSSQQLNVESSFTFFTIIIQAGRGRRKASTDVSMQAHLQNQVLPQRQQQVSPGTGTVMQCKPTKVNLKEIETSVTNYVAAMCRVEKEPVQDFKTDYFAKIERDAARAQPSRRRQYDAAVAAGSIRIRKPYEPDSSEEEMEQKDKTDADTEEEEEND